MTLDRSIIEGCALQLLAAEQEVREVVKITDAYPQIGVDEAYEIQECLRSIKQSAGVRIVGMKMGLTSRPKMQQMGVDTPIYGFLGDDNAVDDGAVVDTARLIHPNGGGR